MNRSFIRQLVRSGASAAAAALVADQYARRKPASGQKDLFADPNAPKQKALFSAKDKEPKGHWITVRGTHVFVEGEEGSKGRILKGPKHFIGLTAAQIEESGGSMGEEKPKPTPINELGPIRGPQRTERQGEMFREKDPELKGLFGAKPGEIKSAVKPAIEAAKKDTSAGLLPDDVRSKLPEHLKDVNPAFKGEADKLREIANRPPSPPDEEEPFRLQQPAPPRPKAPKFEDNQNSKQKSMFDTGKGDLPGQELLFNSDAGDLNNPKTMANKVAASSSVPKKKPSQGGLFGNPNTDKLKKPFRDELHPREKDNVANPNAIPGQFAPKGGRNPMMRVSEHDDGSWTAAATLTDGKEIRSEGKNRREAVGSLVRKAEKIGVVLDYPKEEPEIGGLFGSEKKEPQSSPSQNSKPFSPGMKVKVGDSIKGRYMKGMHSDMAFSGVISSIHTDTAGGNFKSAYIDIDPPVNGRSGLIAMLDMENRLIDDRYSSDDDGPKDGDRNSEGLVFRNGRWLWETAKKELGVHSMVDIPAALRKEIADAAEKNPPESKKASPPPSPGRERAMKRQQEKISREEWDQGVRDEIRSIMGEADYDNADIDGLDGVDAIDRAAGFASIAAVKSWSDSNSDEQVTSGNSAGSHGSQDEGPKDGDRNADGLVFRNGRWHREDKKVPADTPDKSGDLGDYWKNSVSGSVLKDYEEGNVHVIDATGRLETSQKPVSKSGSSESESAAPKPAESSAAEKPSSGSESFNSDTHGGYKPLLDLAKRIDSGELSVEEFKAAHKLYHENSQAFIDDLKKRFNAKQLTNIAGNFGDFNAKTQNKDQNAKSAYERLMGNAFDIGKGMSNTWTMGELRDPMGRSNRLAAHVADQTEDSLKEHVAGLKKSAAEWEAAKKANDEAAENPKTLSDFDLTLKRAGGYLHMKPEQQKLYDELKTEETRGKREELKKPTTVKAEVKGDHGGFDLSKNYHSKRGQDIFTASPNNRVDRDEYNKMNQAAKQLGGWYYKKFGSTPGGFHFPDEEKRDRFLKAMAGESVDRSDIIGEKRQAREQTVSEKLKDHAERLHERALQSYNADRKTNTNRRASMADSARASAAHDLNQAERLTRIAEAMEKGELTHLKGLSAKTHLEALQSVFKQASRKYAEEQLKQKYGDDWSRKAKYEERENAWRNPIYSDESAAYAEMPRQTIWKSNVRGFLDRAAATPGLKQEAARWQKRIASSGDDEKVTMRKDATREWFDFAKRARSKGVKTEWSGFGQEDDFNRLYAMGIQNDHELRAALRELAPFQNGKSSSVKDADPIADLEKEIHRTYKGEGFYPTPPRVIDRLLDNADIEDGHDVLEPSAGSGRIMDAIRAKHSDSVNLSGVEHSPTLNNLLSMKGHSVESGDFLEHKGKSYDRIVMNPPFEKDAAIDHIRHALSLLKPGGKIVAVIPGNERMYREAGRSKRKEFADLVDQHGHFEELDANSFKGSDVDRETGVNTSIVVLHKPDTPEKYHRSQIAQYVLDESNRRRMQPDLYAINWGQVGKTALMAGSLGLADAAFRPYSRNAGVRALNRITRGMVTAAFAAWMAGSGSGATPAGQSAEITPSASKSFQGKWGVDLQSLIQKSLQNKAAADSGWKDQNERVFGESADSQNASPSGNGSDDSGKWITIGGHPGKDGKHMGGTPVQVDSSGEIMKGPSDLKGHDVDEIPPKESRMPVDSRNADDAAKQKEFAGRRAKGIAIQTLGQKMDDSYSGKQQPWEKSGNISIGQTNVVDVDKTQPLHQPRVEESAEDRQRRSEELKKAIAEQTELARKKAAEAKKKAQMLSFDPEKFKEKPGKPVRESNHKSVAARQNIQDVSQEYELTPEELQQAVNDELGSMAEYHKLLQTAKSEIRDRTGLNSANLRLMANRGGRGADASTVRGFDRAADVENHGIEGIAGSSAIRAAGLTDEESVYNAALQKSEDLPGAHDLEWLKGVAERLWEKKQSSVNYGDRADDPVPQTDLVDSMGQPVPFSRTNIRELVHLYSRRARTAKM